jgi:hypothetical protein
MSADTRYAPIYPKCPEPRRPGAIGIAATHPRALARFCPCMSAEHCMGAVDGRNAAGSKCKRHLQPTLAEDCV